MYYCPHTRAIIASTIKKEKKVDLNIANLQMGQIYTMLEETVYFRWAANLQMGIHSVNSHMGQVKMSQIYRKVGT